MAGRPKKPRNIKILQGTLRADRDSSELEFDKITKVPTAPKGLKDKGKTVWNIAANELVNAQILSNSDLPVLEEYCFQFDIIVEAKKEMERGVLTEIVNRGGGKSYIKNPAFTVYSEATQKIFQLSQQFGFTPSSRAKIGAPNESDKSKSSDPSQLLKAI